MSSAEERSIQTAIIRPSFCQTVTFHLLNIFLPRLASEISADIILNEVVPSQAIMILEVVEVLDLVRQQQSLPAIKKMMSQFRNSALICIGDEQSFSLWCEWQLSLEVQPLMLLYAKSPRDAAKLVTNLYTTMTNKAKLEMQSQYFHKLQTDEQVVQQIYKETLEAVGLSDHDVRAVMVRCPTLGSFLLAVADDDLPLLQDYPANGGLRKLLTSDFRQPL